MSSSSSIGALAASSRRMEALLAMPSRRGKTNATTGNLLPNTAPESRPPSSAEPIQKPPTADQPEGNAKPYNEIIPPSKAPAATPMTTEKAENAGGYLAASNRRMEALLSSA